MNTYTKFLALLLSTLALSGCASTSKKNCNCSSQNAPAASSSVAAVEPVAAQVAEPVADEVPAATRKYVNK